MYQNIGIRPVTNTTYQSTNKCLLYYDRSIKNTTSFLLFYWKTLVKQVLLIYQLRMTLTAVDNKWKFEIRLFTSSFVCWNFEILLFNFLFSLTGLWLKRFRLNEFFFFNFLTTDFVKHKITWCLNYVNLNNWIKNANSSFFFLYKYVRKLRKVL